MISPSERFVMVFNGEIYNHLELRERLDENHSVGWRGHSDTETLLVAIEHWGLATALERSVGMFALALWDKKEQTLSLARDRIGEKPLYFGWHDGGLIFASEMKALFALPTLPRMVDPLSLDLYLRYSYVPAPRSILRNIYKVQPGVIVSLAEPALASPPTRPPQADAAPPPHIRIERFWSLNRIAGQGQDETMTAQEAVNELEIKLQKAVEQQMIADVPIGAFLSGGVDSSAIVALISRIANQRVKTFSIGFPQQGLDEAPFAKEVARHLNTDHHELYVTPSDVQAVIPSLAKIYDEPFGDSSQVPTVILSRFARENVTVALSGDGGDELFCGYNRYLLAEKFIKAGKAVPVLARRAIALSLCRVSPGVWNRLGNLPGFPSHPQLGAKVQKVASIFQSKMDLASIYHSTTDSWGDALPTSRDARGEVRLELLNQLSPVEQMMYWDMQTYLPDDILAKVDRASMASSLEVRVPFLDHRVVEQAWRTPIRFKKHSFQSKWILRQILYRQVPRELIERPKAGFSVPIDSWLKNELRDWADQLLSVEALSQHPQLDVETIRLRWNQHLSGSHEWTQNIWSVLMFQAWAQEWKVTS